MLRRCWSSFSPTSSSGHLMLKASTWWEMEYAKTSERIQQNLPRYAKIVHTSLSYWQSSPQCPGRAQPKSLKGSQEYLTPQESPRFAAVQNQNSQESWNKPSQNLMHCLDEFSQKNVYVAQNTEYKWCSVFTGQTTNSRQLAAKEEAFIEVDGPGLIAGCLWSSLERWWKRQNPKAVHPGRWTTWHKAKVRAPHSWTCW